ncbi:MAG: glutathione S-transferase N-terminal domain-containing protein [Candidatus Portnoybacteria bacterium]|nr:glutathione S-transferase N-terminal domain-containing protein [Candidatus Portnoybacteria bacterium]
MIKVYSTPTCPYCVTLKNFLKEKGFEFEDIDVSFDQKAAQEMIDKSGQMGVPVSDIDGQIVIGFDREKICQLLKIEC